MFTKITFNRRNKLSKNGTGIIDIKIYIDRKKRSYRSTGISILPLYWDNRNEKIKATHPDYLQIIEKIQKLQQEIETSILEGGLNSAIDLTKGKVYFYDFFENYVMKVSNNDLSKSTQSVYKRTLLYLKEYHNEDFLITKIDVKFIQGFELFLSTKKKLANNGRSALLCKVKKVLKIAVMNDIINYSENPFNRGFKFHEIPPEHKSLTLSELRKIESLDITGYPELTRTKNMFLFACYTGLRYSDLSVLTSENFEVLNDGRIRLSYIPQKTRHQSNKTISWIISDFWNGKVHDMVTNYLHEDENWVSLPIEQRRFFNFSNAYYNRSLKRLQALAGIKENLTSHLARHTCITLLVNDYALPVEKAQLIAGHSKIEMTMRYLKNTEKALSDAAKNINWNI